MYGLIRRNRRPTVLRRLVSALTRDIPRCLPASNVLPSHHILCAGTYTPVFARLAAETALDSCPEYLRGELRLFIHVDGVSARVRPDLMAWLSEIPNVELTYGMFGILPQDRIPGKWHQTMISDVVRRFQAEQHVAFIDADLFLHGASWFDVLSSYLAADVYSISAGLRQTREMLHNGTRFAAIKTNLFTVNTVSHLHLNQQRSSKDQRAVSMLAREFPDSSLSVPAIDSMVVGSLRAQAHGLRVIDVDECVEYCHVGGFSHLRMNKFHGYETPENSEVIESWLTRLRLMNKVLKLFDARGWGGRVEISYRQKISAAIEFVEKTPYLSVRFREAKKSRHEVAYERIFEEFKPA